MLAVCFVLLTSFANCLLPYAGEREQKKTTETVTLGAII